jgi:hypothetical protein
MAEKMTYAGFNQDTHGITTLGRIVLDAWLFELLPLGAQYISHGVVR